MTIILLITFTSVIPLLFIFVFGNCFGIWRGSTTTHTASLATIFCDETVIKLYIRIVILILVNDCASLCDRTSRIVIRLIVLIDVFKNILGGGIVLDNTLSIFDSTVMAIEFLMAIWIVNELCQALLKINPFILLTFVFDDSTANINITKHLRLFTIVFCDKVLNAMYIRIAHEISTNSCKTPCDSTLEIATKFVRLNDTIDRPITTGIIFDNVVGIGIEIEFLEIVFIAYCIDGTIQSTAPISWLIAVVYPTALIFGIVDSILHGKAQNKVKKQS